MYDTSPHSPLKGDIRQLWPGDISTKDLETLFDLDPALEESLDFTELNTHPGGAVPVVPDSAGVVPTPGAPVDLLTLTTEHLASLESQTPVFTQGVAVTPAVSPVSLHPTSSPGVVPEVAVSAGDLNSAFSQDVLMPEYHSLVAMATTTPPSSSSTTTTTAATSQEEWGSTLVYTTVKTEDLSLSSLTACSLEASLPGFSASNTPCKSEPFSQDDSNSQFSFSPRSTRSLSESSTATSVVPDSPRRPSKGGSRRRQVPKGSEEYKEKRARNNIAVRKSRAKAKEKQRMTEDRVKELLDMNESLRKRLEMLTKEVTVLKGLFINVGASLPEEFNKLMETS